MAGEKHRLHIELTPEEYETLCAKAKEFRLTKREFIVRLVKEEEIKDLREEIHRIRNNINQIAQSVNAGIAATEDAKRALSMLDRVYELITKSPKSDGFPAEKSGKCLRCREALSITHELGDCKRKSARRPKKSGSKSRVDIFAFPCYTSYAKLC